MIAIDIFAGQYRFLSNFYPCDINYQGLVYPTVEHAFQAAKTTDAELRMQIRNASSPTEAKRLGRKVTLREGWETYRRYSVMETLLVLKFGFGTLLASSLLKTGDAVLIEGNTWHDNLWGQCRCEGKCAKPGLNLLGWMLMRQRRALTL